MGQFTPPSAEDLKDFSVAGITDLHAKAESELNTLRASITDPETATDEQLTYAEQLASFTAAAATELQARQDKAARFNGTSATPLPTVPEPEVTEAVTASSDHGFDEAGNKDVTATTPTTDVAGTATQVVDATITAAGATQNAPRRSVQIADAAPHAEFAEVQTGNEAYTIIASSEIPNIPTGTELTWANLGKAFEERTRPHSGMMKGKVTGRQQAPLAMIRRNFPDGQVVSEGDGHETAYLKLRNTSDTFGKSEALVAANGWCAPSEPDYSICSPITTDGLLNLPEMVLRRGGLLHNRGLDFGDFFGDDITLPIPGFNILTEAEVIADTAKTCVEIPCPSFVDDRLNVAALCLTSSLLQNRGYPEFVSEFVQGAVAAMAHLVSREVINEIVTNSTAIDLRTVDPWATDGSVLSNFLSAVDFAAMDLRYIYRAAQNQLVEQNFPYWLKQAIRADWLRRNATFTLDMTDALIDAALAARNVRAQWIYNWQDAFNAGAHPVAVPANMQMGDATPTDLYNVPNLVSFTAWLPGTWVLGRQDVVRLDTVYDSTLLQQNLVTQLFVEDGYKPMRMCQHSRVYTIPICANGSTGVQRAVTCTDVTP